MSPTVTLSLPNGTEATWFVANDRADSVEDALIALLGEPDSIRA